MNTLEQLILMLPALWLCAFWVGDQTAAIGALVWSVGRIIYGVTYLADPKKRGIGFLLTIAPSFVMAILTVLQIARSLT
jgi:glutathione S-transferase